MITEDTEEFITFFEGCKRIYHEYVAIRWPANKPVEFSYKFGRRHAKIIKTGSVHYFVDLENGDVLKAASWKVPVKHARGNIFDDNNGLEMMNWTGPAYLRG